MTEAAGRTFLPLSGICTRRTGCGSGSVSLLLDGTHPLVRAGLVEVSGDSDSLELTVAGQRIFFWRGFRYIRKAVHGSGQVLVCREVSEYVHGSAHETKSPKALDKLAEKIRLMEDSNGSLEVSGKN